MKLLLGFITLLLGCRQLECLTIVGNITWFMNTTSSSVTAMSEDPFIPGNLLFADYGVLKTTKDGKNVFHVVGNSNPGYQEGVGAAARFRTITDFKHLNRTHLLLSDEFNHCLRILNRLLNSTSAYAGKCEVMGAKDGYLADARFWRPNGIAIKSSFIYVADFCNDSLRMIDNHTGYVFTYYKSVILKKPRGIALDSSKNNLLILSNHGILSVDISSSGNGRAEKYTNLTTVNGFKDGEIKSSLWDYPTSIILISKNIYAVADLGNRRIRLIDNEKNRVTSICNQRRGKAIIYGPANNCLLLNPRSIALIGGTLYIGMDQTIATILLDFDSSEAFDTKTTTEVSVPRLRLLYQSLYDVRCIYLSGDGPTSRFVDAIMNRYQTDVDAVCKAAFASCKVESPSRFCVNDVMTVKYNTNLAITQDDLYKAELKSKEKQQSTSQFMRQSIIAAPAPAVLPIPDKNGLALSPILLR